MTTIAYYLGEVRDLGFPVSEYDGAPIDTRGLGCRLSIYQAGPDLHIIGDWQGGQVDDGQGPFFHPAIATFAASPNTMPAYARAYRVALEIDAGDGWQIIGQHIIDVRRP